MFPCTCCVSRYRFPDEDFNSGLNHHHPAALGYCRTGEVRCNTAYSHVYHPYILHVLYVYLISSHSFHPCLFRFRSITEQYYRKADGILAMYDITHSPSFTAVRGWLDSVKVSRWRWHRWFDVKTCKTVCLNLNTHAGNWEHSAIRISIATNAMGVINLNFLFWGLFLLCDVFLTIDIFFASVFNTSKSVYSNLCVFVFFPGEDVWRCRTDAAGEQAGPGRQSQQKSDSSGGAETSRGEAQLNIQTTFCSDLLIMARQRKEHDKFVF